MGLEGNQLALSVSKGVERVTGVNPMGVMGITHIPKNINESHVSVKNLGHRAGVSSQKMNKMLTGAGLQNAYRDADGTLCYELTDEGKAVGGAWHDTQKAQGGRPVPQLMWPLSLADKFAHGGAA